MAEIRQLAHVLLGEGRVQLRQRLRDRFDEQLREALEADRIASDILHEDAKVDVAVGKVRRRRDGLVAGVDMRRRSRRARHPLAQRRIENIRVHRLRDDVVHSAIHAARPIFAARVRGQGEDGDTPGRGIGAQPAGRLEPVHHRHLHVHQDAVVVGLARPRDALAAVLGHVDHGADGLEQPDRQFAVDAVVLDHEDAGAAQRIRRFMADRQRIGRDTREPDQEPERAAGALGAVDAHPAAHQLGDLLAGRQAETVAAETPRERGVHLVEGLEQAGDVAFVQADAVVAHLQPHFIEVIAAGEPHGDDAHMAGRAELDRIADVVDQDLADALRIAAVRTCEERRHLERELQPLRARGRGGLARDPVHHVGELELDVLQDDLAGHEPGEIQDVLDDVEQVLAGDADLLQEFALRRRRVGAQGQVGHAHHAVDGRQELVADVRQEAALGLVGHVRRLQGHLEVARARRDAQLERLVQRGQALRHAAQVEMRAHARPHDRRVHRLADEVHRAQLQAQHFLAGLVLRRDEDDRDVVRARVGLELAADLVAAQVGHHHVQQDEVGQALAADPQRIDTAGRHQHAVVRCERLVHRSHVDRLVVDDQQGRHLGGARVGKITHGEAPASGQVGEDRAERGGAEGLAQRTHHLQPLEPRHQRGRMHGAQVHARHQHHGALEAPGTQRFHELEAVAGRHVEVAHHQLRRSRPRGEPRALGGVFGGLGLDVHGCFRAA